MDLTRGINMDSLHTNGRSMSGSDRPASRTVFSAFLLSFSYLVGGLFYIYFSGRLAIRFSENIDQLEFIERYKGYGFILVSASGLFVLAAWLMRRIQLREREIAEYRTQMLRADQRATAGLLASSIAHNIKNLLMGVDFAVTSLDPKALPRAADIKILQKANVLINAGDATANAGQILVKVSEEASGIVLEVHDSGTGVPEEIKEKIMQPLFTTKPDGCGLGMLSLEICCQDHAGVYSIQTSPLGGAAFVIHFPVKSGS